MIILLYYKEIEMFRDNSFKIHMKALCMANNISNVNRLNFKILTLEKFVIESKIHSKCSNFNSNRNFKSA